MVNTNPNNAAVVSFVDVDDSNQTKATSQQTPLPSRLMFFDANNTEQYVNVDNADNRLETRVVNQVEVLLLADAPYNVIRFDYVRNLRIFNWNGQKKAINIIEETELKAGLTGITAQNTTASTIYIQFYKGVVSDVVVGTTLPLATFIVEANKIFSLTLSRETALITGTPLTIAATSLFEPTTTDVVSGLNIGSLIYLAQN